AAIGGPEHDPIHRNDVLPAFDRRLDQAVAHLLIPGIELTVHALDILRALGAPDLALGSGSLITEPHPSSRLPRGTALRRPRRCRGSYTHRAQCTMRGASRHSDACGSRSLPGGHTARR